VNEYDAYRAGPTQDTLRALLKAQGDAAYNICFQVLREGSQAEDAAQQVLLDLVKQLPRISDASHLRAWVSRAAFHAALDLKKKARRRAAHERRTAEMAKTPALTTEQVEAVHTEIARLDDDLRRVVVEHYFEKRALRDLAAEQAISEVAVWKRLQKAKERLRASLATTGFAAALIGLDSLLEALEPVRAPEGFVQTILPGASTSLLLAGGIAMKIKLIVAAGVVALLLLSGVAVTVARNRDREPEVALRPAKGEVQGRESASTSAADRRSAVFAGPTPVPEEVQVFTTYRSWVEAIMKASYVVDTAERARTFRRIGLPISDAEMAAASKGCPFRPGTEEFSKHLLRTHEGVMGGQDPGKGLAMIRGFTDLDDKTRRELLGSMFDHWVRRNPATARAAAATLSESEGRVEILARVAEPKTSPEEVARILALPLGIERSRALQASATALVRADPSAAVRMVEALPPGQNRTEAAAAMVGEWARRDFAAALAWAEKQGDREIVVGQAISTGAEFHPKEAADAAVRLVGPKDSTSYTTVYSVAASLARSDPAAAAKFLDRFSAMEARRFAITQEVAPRWGATDPVEALVWAQQLPAQERQEAIRAVLAGWVKSPKGNLAEVREMTRHLPEALRPRAIEAVAMAWGEIDPPAAASFALKEAPAALMEVVSRWMVRDEVGALAWARGLSDPAARDQALFGMSRISGEFDTAKGIRFAEEIREPALRDQRLGQLARSASKGGGLEAGLDILRKVQDPGLRDESLSMMVANVTREDPRKAAALVERMADPRMRSRAIDSILAWGSEKDPDLCRELLQKLPRVQGLQYQQVAGGFAKKDPIAAATWALTLPEKQMDSRLDDPSKEYESRPRDSAVNQVINEWASKDPDAATGWIRSATMPEALRASLLRTVKFQRDSRRR